MSSILPSPPPVANHVCKPFSSSPAFGSDLSARARSSPTYPHNKQRKSIPFAKSPHLDVCGIVFDLTFYELFEQG